jgi:hypothetical protein
MGVPGAPARSAGWREGLRTGQSLGEARALRGEVTAWRARWDSVDAMGGHLTVLDLLSTAILSLVDEITRRIDAIDPRGGTGAVYEECRGEDVRLLHVRRLWRWYADKLDQRIGPHDDAVVRTLLAADEVIWSCWKTAFTALGAAVPPAPIPYLTPQYSASATPRTDPPPDLRPGRDDLLCRHIELLPVAVIGLPPVCIRRPWWLILGVHEAGHHLQFELPGLEELTQNRVVAAAYQACGDLELAEAWRPWCRELFADACSVLLAGPAASWAVGELEMRAPAGLGTSASGSYPPPLVRLAVLHAVGEQAGLPAGPQAFSDQDAAAAVPSDGGSVARMLAVVPGVAGALLGLAPAGRPLRSLAATTTAAYREGRIAGWRTELLGPDEPVPVRTLAAARCWAAAGVQAWERSGDSGQLAAERLSGRLLDVLPSCREPGVRAGGPAPAADDITRQLIADLYQPDPGRLALT